MTPYYVYIVECNDGSYYTGITTDPERRVCEHNDGRGARYTRSRRPVRLVHCESAADRADASRREHEIKNLTRPAKDLLVAGASEKGERQ